MKVMKITACVVCCGLIALAAAPAFAASKSVTVRVSCTILPMMELTAAKKAPITAGSALTQPNLAERPELGLSSQGPLVTASSNLGKNYRMDEAIRKTSSGTMKLYSVTAL